MQYFSLCNRLGAFPKKLEQDKDSLLMFLLIILLEVLLENFNRVWIWFVSQRLCPGGLVLSVMVLRSRGTFKGQSLGHWGYHP
jgi:hypothetical protein